MTRRLNKLYVGPRHTAVTTEDGSLYTFGSGSWGVLGHGDEKGINPSTPKRVEFFTERNIKIQECKSGEYHTMALTTDGQVYTWGYAGKVGYFSWMFAQEVGALGHGDKKPYFIPKKVTFFDTIKSKVVQIAAGLYHWVALTEDGDVYTWGRGQHGVLGNGSNSYSLQPELNQDIAALKEEGIKIVKIDSAEDFTAALTDAGEVYVFGKNDRGQLGIGAGIGIDMQESWPVPTPLVFEDGKSPTFDDVYWGQNTMILKDVECNVWKTGLKLDYNPKKIVLANDKDFGTDITAISWGRKHYMILNSLNQMLVWGNVFSAKSHADIQGFNMYFGDNLFDGEKWINLITKYGLFGAITQTRV